MAESSQNVRARWIQTLGLHEYEGLLLLKSIKPHIVEEAKSFDFYQEDILIDTYPRSGTTWTQEMTWLICNNADVETARQVDLDQRSRFLEIHNPKETFSEMEELKKTPPPRIIKSHLPCTFFEKQLEKIHFKIIVVMRNLKDVIVSHFHFYQKFLNLKSSWDEFFETVKDDDKMVFGSWSDHCLGWWRMRHSPNILILKYEDMKKNSRGAAQQIADHSGKVLTSEQMDAITEFCSVDSMKGVPSFKSKMVDANDPRWRVDFIWKGVVGNWKDWFSKEQSDNINEYMKSTTEKEGLYFDDVLK